MKPARGSQWLAPKLSRPFDPWTVDDVTPAGDIVLSRPSAPGVQSVKCAPEAFEEIFRPL